MSRRLVIVTSLVTLAAACGDDPKKRLGATCGDDAECESGLCVVSLCMEPSADTDQDGLANAVEARLGTSPLLADTDGDGARDIDELDTAGANLDTDGDGLPDAIESATADADGDCIPDQLDPADAGVDPAGCGGLALGARCASAPQCASGLCLEVCLDPQADEDRDGLRNGVELTLGTDPFDDDTDHDGEPDGDEVDGATHRDTDHDGKGDALESDEEDVDGDCLPDESDPRDGEIDEGGCEPIRVMWNIVFEPMIDVSICRVGGQTLLWSSHNFAVDGQGQLDETWAPNEPNTARLVGTLDATLFQATLACVINGGSPSGLLRASRSGEAYAGTFDFSGKSGSIVVFPGEVDTITVQGRVSQVGTNLPIAGAVVRASVDELAQAVTGPTGLFYLQTSAPATGGQGSYRITVTAQGYTTLEQDHTWGDHPTMQSFQLSPAP